MNIGRTRQRGTQQQPQPDSAADRVALAYRCFFFPFMPHSLAAKQSILVS